MDHLIVEANAKINLGLTVTGQRPDGYHLLDMLMVNISLADTVTLEAGEGISLAESLPGVPDEKNLVYRAAALLARHTGTRRGCRIGLQKYIPSQAGLGGGSADAAAVLAGLDRLWGLRLPLGELRTLALSLGADVPFFLEGGAARARGIGEVLTPLPAFPRLELVVVKPREGLSTPAVYRAWRAEETPPLEPVLAALAAGDPDRAFACMGNALEPPACRLCPAVPRALAVLRRAGARAALMTGSGTAVLGWFEDGNAAARAASALTAAGWQTWAVHTGIPALRFREGV